MPSSPPAVCLSSSVLGVENEGDDPLDWLRSSIPGEPGTDYPIMAATQVSTHHSHTPFQTDIVSFQDSGFSCDGLVFGGYYADPATECQQYSVCLQVVQICTIFFLQGYAERGPSMDDKDHLVV